MRREIKALPKEMQEAYKKVQNRPDENTPAYIMDFTDQDKFMETFLNPYMICAIVDWVDDKLLDLELDERDGVSKAVYRDFAIEVAKKIMGTIDIDTNESKPLDFYDKNEKIHKLKMKDYVKIGDMAGKSDEDQADILAAFYGVQDADNYKKLTLWEKRLFVDKVMSRQDTSMEKN